MNHLQQERQEFPSAFAAALHVFQLLRDDAVEIVVHSEANSFVVLTTRAVVKG